MNKLQSLQSVFLDLLTEAQKQRAQRCERVLDELEWVVYERGVMLKAVNKVRLHRNCFGVVIEEIKRVETFAVGHCDYSQKFALYCAELALQR